MTTKGWQLKTVHGGVIYWWNGKWVCNRSEAIVAYDLLYLLDLLRAAFGGNLLSDGYQEVTVVSLDYVTRA